ncbi:cytochrome C [Geobacter sp. AOG2]|uniref:cytochrome C n=1 Tax=Geobacter sp. AOG2 TaxID=1566347 RepID=UPI001CC596B8|nr:cytochrome C [Geobacter sp. AOG2]GFE60346.1 C-type polyheme cytochrome OmcC [Geobacter sp. AOG2]
MVSRFIAASLLLATLLLALAGCGEKTVTAAGTTKLAQSETCFNNNCHQNAISPGTGKNIAEEWKLSVHNTSNAAGCADCHEPEPGHPDSCNRCHGGTPSGTPDSTNHVSKNPDTDKKCSKCHGSTYTDGGTFNSSTRDGVIMDVKFYHFSSGKRANYVATNYVGYCRKCHNPHDTTSGRDERQQWSRSGHGDTESGARTTYDFKTRGSSIVAKDNFGNFCVRCHTTTGYITYVSSGFSDVNALPDFDGTRSNYPAASSGSTSYMDKSRELTNCNACHDDGRPNDGSAYSGKLRVVPTVTVYYNFSATKNLAGIHDRAWDVKYSKTLLNHKNNDYGASNICVVCHSGRELGLIAKIANANGLDFTNVSYRSLFSHDGVAAVTLAGIGGFQFYSSASKYAIQSYFKHDLIGTADSGNIGGSNGPCIGCHLKNSLSHYFLPVTRDVNGTILDIVSNAQVCSNAACHSSTNVNSALWVAGANGNLQAIKNGFAAAMEALNQMLLSPGQNPANKLKPTATGAYKTDWTLAFGNAVVPGSGDPRSGLSASSDIITQAAYTFGAAFNYEMLMADSGAYAHNSLYAKRLIYDSLDWLNNGIMDNDAKTALDYLVTQGVLTSGTAESQYEMALSYLCGTKSDPSGSLGRRP